VVWPRNKLGDPVCIAHDLENSLVDLVQFVLWPQNLPVEPKRFRPKSERCQSGVFTHHSQLNLRQD